MNLKLSELISIQSIKMLTKKNISKFEIQINSKIALPAGFWSIMKTFDSFDIVFLNFIDQISFQANG